MFNVSTRPASGGARTTTQAVLALLFLAVSPLIHAQARVGQADVFKPPPPVTYTERFEAYGGINFANGQAGQNLPKRYNMAGGEGMLTYFITPKLGAAVDYRWQGGTTPVLPIAQTYGIQTRPFVSQSIIMGGVQYRGPHSQKAALAVHALAGVSNGNFSHSTLGLDPTASAGLYRNHSAFNGVVGASVDLNRSARWAVRLSPDMVFESFGTETRIFFAISGGVVYRFGHK